jgi:deoxycytidylate deaminase
MLQTQRVQKPELFFGLVGAVGTNLDKVATVLSKTLAMADFDTTIIRLSDLLHGLPRYENLPTRFADEYIDTHMTAGDEFRKLTERKDAVALLGVGKVKELRVAAEKKDGQIIPNRSFIFRSLKTPGEVESLRKIYGASFYLIAAYTALQDRRVSLAKRIAKTRNLFPYERHFTTADRLIDRDQEEIGNASGQNTRDSFHRADLFVDTSDFENLDRDINRFVELLLGHPFHTPSKDEYAMFHAHAAALRSAELGRQVGSAIATRDGNIVAVGCNEVAKAGGGLYWDGEAPDKCEFRFGMDGIEEQKRNLIAETLRMFSNAGWLEPGKAQLGINDLVDLALHPVDPVLPKDSKIRSLIEFGRAVHGEMAALTDAARRGVSVQGCIMYVTTFPCHLCARHIVSAGIASVIYVEPYAKSLAAELYPDSITVDHGHKTDNQIPFTPFVGIAPRQYMDLFTPGRRKNSDGSIVVFTPKSAYPKFVQESSIYLENEIGAFKSLRLKMKEKGLLD